MAVRVIIEMKGQPSPGAAVTAAAEGLAGVEIDPTYGVDLPAVVAGGPDASAAFALEGDESTYLVRGVVDEDRIDAVVADPSVVQVFSDTEIQACVPVCPSGAARGNAADVAAALCTNALAREGADGSGVLVAIVDSGINLAHLQGLGLNPATDPGRSWVPNAGQVPFNMPVGHGTMCAFDALIAAPRATLLDVAVLASTASGPTAMSGVLSDAIRAYRHLIDVMNAPRRPGDTRSMVVNNSWAMFHPSWDFPVGHPGNYSDNPNHPFNRIVVLLESAGADIVFAAGNCGANCPDGRCQGVTNAGIFGANSSPSVLSVAGVDIHRERAGYSNQGPGRLTRNKPDIAGYTHFRGSGVYAADGGTSAASPVVAGVVAAVRTVRPFNPAVASRTPAAIRNLLTSTAVDLGPSGYDFDHGFGVVDGCALARRLRWVIRPPFDLCKYLPDLCRPKFPIDICKRYPWICEGLQEIELIPGIGPGPIKGFLDFVREVVRFDPDLPIRKPPTEPVATDSDDGPAEAGTVAAGPGGCC